MTFASPKAAARTRVDSQQGQLEVKAHGSYAFSVAIERETRATSNTSGDTILVDRITAQGSHGLAGHEWLGPDGTSLIRISGRLGDSNHESSANYSGSVKVNIAYN